MIRGLSIAAAGVLAGSLWLCSCGEYRGQTGGAGERPKPLFELAGQSQASQVTELPFLPGGPGASGRVGDFLLENALARFVVASADHTGPGQPAGNVIDAAVQGGEDRMRLLSLLLGAEPAVRPVYTEVRIQHPGGTGASASVVASGHLPGRDEVTVVTVYSLPPDSPSLEIATTVENGTDATLAQFGLRDVLYHGRTLRFAPGTVLASRGKKSASTWLSFFWHDRSWGVVSRMGTMEVEHNPGSSELRYATVDIPPRQARGYQRLLVAAAGGPEAVWQAAYPTAPALVSRLQFELTEVDSGAPVGGAEILLVPADTYSPVLLVSDEEGRAQLELRAGRYAVAAVAPGRPPVGPAYVTCMAGQSHRLRMPLAPRAEASVRTRSSVGEFSTPTAARVSCYRTGEQTTPFPASPAFPIEGESAVALADGAVAARLPLAPAAAGLPASWLVVASKGPQYERAIVPVAAQAGQTADLDMSLQRAVEADGYVSADLRQHTEESLDCALTLAERALADACEGLDVAVVSDPVYRTVLVGTPSPSECTLIPGLRLELEGVGSFSVYPLEAAAPVPDLEPVLRPGRPAGDVVADLRRLFPDAVIQVDNPLDRRKGYFALSGWAQGPPPSGAADFDAIEILTGGDVPTARTLLRHWFSLLNSGRRVMVTGGSGSRAIGEEVAGTGRTFFHCPRQRATVSAAEAVAALRALRTAPNAFVTNGPFIEATLNGQPIGSLQTVPPGRVRMQLRILAPLWVDVTRFTVYRNGRPVEESLLPAPTGPLRCDRALELDAAGDCWFVVLVEGRRPMSLVYPGGADAPQPFAVTNPFWVDADGDGQVTVRQ